MISGQDMVKHYAGLENIVLCLHLTKLIMNHDGVTYYVNLRPDGILLKKTSVFIHNEYRSQRVRYLV